MADRLQETVGKILRSIQREGDRALLRYTRRFDHWNARRNLLEVSDRERREAKASVTPREIRALQEAARRIRQFHKHQIPRSWEMKTQEGRLGLRWEPIDRVGIYIPGGLASYPSTVLMTVIPARLAGVREIVMVTPYPNGRGNQAVLTAANLVGVDRIFKIGGAQAIGALAYGTKTIPSVDKIVGPGNRYVAEAKRQVFGVVGIDAIAGPTELVLIADQTANAAWVAMDLISQAEHDPEARPILISPSRRVIRAVAHEVEERVRRIERKKIASRAFWRHGQKILVRDLKAACRLANEIAPEHLSLQVKDPRRWANQIHHAGAIFLGPFSAVAAGDYGVGPNHVLPTSGTARFASPLGVYDFMKAMSVIEIHRDGLRRMAPTIQQLARMEALTAHGESVEVRLKR